MRELALFIVPTYVLAVTTVLSNLLYSHGNKDTLDELFFGEGGGHCVFKWILRGHLKPSPIPTI